MTAAADESRPEARPAEPFVGLRPYERSEGQLFKGRDRDAQYLTNKVFASRLTLLYANGRIELLSERPVPRKNGDTRDEERTSANGQADLCAPDAGHSDERLDSPASACC